jgi:hypothetical protein
MTSHEYQRRQMAVKKEPIMVEDYVAKCCGTCRNGFDSMTNLGKVRCGFYKTNDMKSPFELCMTNYERRLP